MTNDVAHDARDDVAETDDPSLASPPDDRNPAIIDAEHTFIVLIIGAALFIGAVFVFIL
jgi:hypothetical protein